MENLELVVFDMGGTTVSDHGEVPAAFTGALTQHGIEISADQLNSVRGRSKREAVLQLVPEGLGRESRAEEVYKTFRENLWLRYQASGVSEVAGATVIFQSLRNRGVRVALNTGFDREITTLLLNALAWTEGLVDAVICGDDVSQGRPAPYLIFCAMEAVGAHSVHKVANVGDTVQDLLAGHNAGVRWNVGVLSGAHPRVALQGAPHTHILPSIADLLGLWGEA